MLHEIFNRKTIIICYFCGNIFFKIINTYDTEIIKNIIINLIISVSSFSGALIIKKPSLSYSYNILPMKNDNMGPRRHVWVSWSAGAPLITNMGDIICILPMLAILFPGTQIILLSGTQTMNKSTTPTRDHCIENGR